LNQIFEKKLGGKPSGPGDEVLFNLLIIPQIILLSKQIYDPTVNE